MMSLMLYIPFFSVSEAEGFKRSVLMGDVEYDFDQKDICTLYWDDREHINVSSGQLLTRRGFVGSDFWEVVLISLFAKVSICNFAESENAVNLSLDEKHPNFQLLCENIRSRRPALILMLRKSNSRLVFQKIIQMLPETLDISLTDEDELNVQKALSKRAKSQVSAPNTNDTQDLL